MGEEVPHAWLYSAFYGNCTSFTLADLILVVYISWRSNSETF